MTMLNARCLCCVVLVVLSIGCNRTQSGETELKLDGKTKRADATQQPPVVDTKHEIEPDLQQARLMIAAESLKPTRISRPWTEEHAAGNYRVSVGNSKIVVSQAENIEQAWSAVSPDGNHLQWLTGHGGIAYFQAYKVDDHERFAQYVDPLEIRRLDLKERRWLDPLRVKDQDQAAHDSSEVLAALADNHRVVVLETVVETKTAKNADHVSMYTVRSYGHGESKARWTRSFTMAEPRLYTGGHLWAPRGPNYAASNVNHLSWLGDRLLVCAEAKQPILCLNRETGAPLWTCERIWEYERGFIGPSVWSHYIDRFGIETMFHDQDGARVASARREFTRQVKCSIVGGPIAVPLTFNRDGNTHSIFVAVSREPDRAFSGYLADCLVYELNDQGKPISMVTLPQSVYGAHFQLVRDGLVWQGQNDSLAMLCASRHSPNIGFGPGGSDLQTRIGWFRQISQDEQSGWLVADRAGDPIAFNRTNAVRLPAGGFVAAKDDRVYQFPISIVDLNTGIEKSITLRVPFHGELRTPATNYSETRLPHGSPSFHTMGPYKLAITHLELLESRLQIVLGMEEWTGSLDFDIHRILATSEKSGDVKRRH
jgi:hypothetical protein